MVKKTRRTLVILGELRATLIMIQYVMATDKAETVNQLKSRHELDMARRVFEKRQGSGSRVLPICLGRGTLLYVRPTPSLFQILRILHSITSIE